MCKLCILSVSHHLRHLFFYGPCYKFPQPPHHPLLDSYTWVTWVLFFSLYPYNASYCFLQFIIYIFSFLQYYVCLHLSIYTFIYFICEGQFYLE